MAVKISTNGPQAANFKILMQSFQKVENGQTCFAGEFECNNNRCIRELNKCDGYDNCGDLSDETYDRCKPTVYLDEVCGMSITIYDMIKLKSSRSTSLIPSLACRVDLSSQTGGGFGGSPRILAHVRNLNLQPATLGLCQRSRIDMYDGIRDPFVITGKNGLCGQSSGGNYATYNDSFLSLELKTDPQPQIGSFDFTVTSFHVNEGQGCSSGEWQCSNLRCIDDYLRCNGYNNCGDNSDETDDFCQVLETLAGGAIAAIVIGALLFAVGFPLLMFYVLCHKKKTSYTSI
ncbi:hypothetical protein FSP39_009483 [Pinctada imbricata]|uniref:Uncharacterized protein n=1 Tax=Pinctada imbricata TaxID=66713 RepID=A0AA89BNY7_PINIB|nr:hypothetical protein FSP39_009483 [Pinctada imbricata]